MAEEKGWVLQTSGQRPFEDTRQYRCRNRLDFQWIFQHRWTIFMMRVEEILVMGDIGIATTTKIIEKLKERVAQEKIKDPAECKQLLIDSNQGADGRGRYCLRV